MYQTVRFEMHVLRGELSESWRYVSLSAVTLLITQVHPLSLMFQLFVR